MGSDLEHGQTTVTTVAQCQSIQSLMVAGGQAVAMYMSSPWGVPGGLGSRCRTRLFSGSARDGKCSRPILERDVCFFLYELPCANQAIIKETKRRVEKQQDFC